MSKRQRKGAPGMDTQQKAILFDLHGVVFKTNFKQILSILWHVKGKAKLAMIGLNPRFWFHFIKLTYHNAIPEEYVMRLIEQFNQLKPYFNTGIKLANAQYPVHKTITIIKQLKTMGYKVYIFSNIGQHTYYDLEQQYPQICALFDGFWCTSNTNNFLKKPHPDAFSQCAQQYNCSFDSIIFIDDKHKNINGARSLGIDSIYFKNSSQLIKALTLRNIMVEL